MQKYRGLVLFFLLSNLYSQNIDYQFINISLSSNYGYVLDKVYSPNIYNRLGGNFGIGYKNRNMNRIIEVSIDANAQFISSKTFPMYDNKIGFYYYGEIGFNYLFKLTEYNLFGKDNKIFLGPEILGYASMVEIDGFSNNSINYSGFIDLGPKLELDFGFDILKKPFFIDYSIIVPLFSYSIRPGYSNPYYYTSRFNFIGKNYLRLNTEIFLEFDIKEVNKFSIGYRWQYINHEDLNKVQIVDSYLILKFCYAI